MKLAELKEFVEYAKSQKMQYLKLGEIEFSFTSESYIEELPPAPAVEEMSDQELVRTVTERVQKDEQKFLQELFQP